MNCGAARARSKGLRSMVAGSMFSLIACALNNAQPPADPPAPQPTHFEPAAGDAMSASSLAASRRSTAPPWRAVGVHWDGVRVGVLGNRSGKFYGAQPTEQSSVSYENISFVATHEVLQHRVKKLLRVNITFDEAVNLLTQAGFQLDEEPLNHPFPAEEEETTPPRLRQQLHDDLRALDSATPR